MAISLATRPPSNQQHYDAFWSGDPAFVQDGPELQEKRTRARETGDWSELLIAGLAPTKFVMRQVSGTLKRRILDQHTAGKVGDRELDALLVRIAIAEVSNLGDFTLRSVDDAQWGRLASEELIELLDRVAPGAVGELAIQVFNRMMGLSGKS